MDKYRKHNYNSLPEHNMRYIRGQSPSFSSTLLDQIYRSIDETNDHHVVADVDDDLVHYRETYTIVEAKDEANCERIENWMDKKKGSEIKTKTHAGADHIYKRKIGVKFGSLVNLNSSWSSSDSSSGGLFSSEAGSNYGVSSKSSSTTTFRPKPIKTSTEINKILRDDKRNQESGGVVKRSKLKALKIYGDLKKVKQPISPGAKLASFLNSLFTAGGGNGKKGKIDDSLNTSPACSTSRSCLSKSPGKLSNNGTKRSVRFYPVSVVVDEDCQPCGHKSLQHGHNLSVSNQRNYVSEESMYHIRSKKQSVEEAARELLKNYQRKVECQMEEDHEDEDEDDDASYASSDLFELDNLNNDNYTGINDYMEELPVYETTYLNSLVV